MQWIGFKRVAFVPVLRSEASPPDVAPANWEAEILLRLVCQTGTAGVDKSLRSWLFTVSSGIADLDPVVLGPVTVPTLSLPNVDADLGARLRNDGVVHAVIVFPGRDRLPVDGFWSGIGMGDTDGAWAKCVVRGVTRYADISHQDDSVGGQFDMGVYDPLAGESYAHPCVYTKRALGWLPAEAVVVHKHATGEYDLQFASLRQPPVAGRLSGVQYGQGFPKYVVEARGRTDPFEQSLQQFGVLPYRVMTESDVAERQGKTVPLYVDQSPMGVGTKTDRVGPASITVLSEIPGGFRIRIELSEEPITDRTEDASAPPPYGDPTAIVNPATATEYLVHRDHGGNIIVLWRTPQGSGVENVSAGSGVPPAPGTIGGYVDHVTGSIVLLYRGEDAHIHTVFWSTGAAGYQDLTAAAGAPPVASEPVGWMTPAGVNHVAYRGEDGQVNVLWWEGAGVAALEDMSASTGVRASGELNAYYDTVRGNNVVIVRDVASHIRSIYWADGPAGTDDWSAVAGVPDAGADPIAWFSAGDDTQNVVYATADGRLIHLSSQANGTVTGRDLSAAAKPVTRPVADGSGDRHRVLYTDDRQDIHEISWRGAEAPAHERHGWPDGRAGDAVAPTRRVEESFRLPRHVRFPHPRDARYLG